MGHYSLRICLRLSRTGTGNGGFAAGSGAQGASVINAKAGGGEWLTNQRRQGFLLGVWFQANMIRIYIYIYIFFSNRYSKFFFVFS